MAEPKLSQSYASAEETQAYQQLYQALRNTPVPAGELLKHLSLYLNRSLLAHILFMHDLYQRILNLHGIIAEFGVRWGRNLALFTMLRTLYEPHNFGRRIVGFDTFGGFPSVSPKDGSAESVAVGTLSVTPGYEVELDRILRLHEMMAPRSHLQKFELVKGDVRETLPQYLEKHPETIIALAYVDFDLYEPTRKCLELIKNHLTRGSVIGFDELTLREYPGETVAFQEVIGSRNCRLQRNPIVPYQSFIVVE